MWAWPLANYNIIVVKKEIQVCGESFVTGAPGQFRIQSRVPRLLVSRLLFETDRNKRNSIETQDAAKSGASVLSDGGEAEDAVVAAVRTMGKKQDFKFLTF